MAPDPAVLQAAAEPGVPLQARLDARALRTDPSLSFWAPIPKPGEDGGPAGITEPGRFLSSDLSLTKRDAPDPVCQNADLTYFLSVQNNGPDAASNVVLTDAIPAGFSLGITDNADDLEAEFDQGTYDGTEWAGGLRRVVQFASDFSSAITELRGSAVIASGRLELTTAPNTGQAGALVATPGDSSLLNRGFLAEFKLNIGGGTGADGFSFNAGLIPSGLPALAEEGFGTGLNVNFDTYGTDGSTIEVKYGGAVMGAATGVTLRNLGWVNVWILMDPSGRVSVGHNGAVLLSNVATGWTPQPTWKFALAARTGASMDNHWVDDLSIVVPEGTFTSRVFNAGADAHWTTLFWNPLQPYLKRLPDSGASESEYSSGNASMSGNVLLMHMEEASGAIADGSGQGNGGTYTGTGYAAQGRVGKGLSFDADGDTVTIPDSSSLNMTTAMTLSAWVRPDAFPGAYMYILREGGDSYGLMFENRKPDFFVRRSGSARHARSAAPLSPAGWYHVAGTWNGAGDQILRLYVNGVEVLNYEAQNTVASPCATSTQPLYINSPTDWFQGTVDEVAVWNRALSAAEIQAMYRRGMPLEFQVRACDYSDCADAPPFLGPDGTAFSYFTEQDNESLGLPRQAAFLEGAHQYAQYKVRIGGERASSHPQVLGVGLSYVGDEAFTLSQGACGISGTGVICRLGSVAGGGSASLSIRGTPGVVAILTNSASVSTSDTDRDLDNNTATAETEVKPSTDADSDGVCDALDNCPAVENAGQQDADGDGLGDACDPCTDTDGDGYGDPGFSYNACGEDNCPDGFNPGQEDIDADGIPDACDLCPTISNPGQEDGDGDGTGTPCDNCPATGNADQADTDYPPGIVAAWHFTEGSGTTAADTPGTHDGTLLNGPVWAPGYKAGAVYFDGGDDVVSVPHDAALDPAHLTAAAWIKARSWAGWGGILAKDQPSPGVGWALLAGGNGGGRISFTFANADSSWFYAETDMVIPLDAWTHVAATYDGDRIRLYVNGVLRTDGGSIGAAIMHSSGGLAIGRAMSGAFERGPFNGAVDEAMLFSRALNDAEIVHLYEAGSGDGLGDGCDNCPAVYNPGQEDADGDGEGDVCDTCTDTDGDGRGNPGFPLNTCPADNCPAVPNPGWTDGDGDGLGDACDNCPAVSNADQADGDSDGIGNLCDNCPTAANPGQGDGDGDGVGDACDNCPTVFNPGQADGDGDFLGDACDNCPLETNASQADADVDGLGDACDNCPEDSNPGQEDADYPSGIVSAWQLDEASGTAAADTPGANDGTLANGPVWTAGHSGTALSFDGVDDHVAVPNDPSLDPAQMTVMAWIKAPAWPEGYYTGAIVAKDLSAATPLGGWAMRCGGQSGYGTLVFWKALGSSSGIQTSTNPEIPPDTWTHVAVTYNGKTIRLYIGGVERHTLSVTGSPTPSSQELRLGAGSDTPLKFFNGLIDDAAVFDRVLSAGEIQSIVQNGTQDGIGDACDNCPSLPNASQADTDTDGRGDGCDNCPGTVNPGQEDTDFRPGALSIWLFEEGAGSVTADAQGPRRGTLTNGPAWWVGGHDGSGTALAFDGADDYVSVPHDGALDPPQITVAAWIRADSWKPEVWEGTIIAKDQAAPMGGWALRCGNGGRLSFAFAVNGSWIQMTSAVTMPLNTWTHVAGTYDGGYLRIYIGGVEMASATVTGVHNVSSGAMLIGESPGFPGRRFDGLIDEAAVFDRALNDSEIQRIILEGYATGDGTGDACDNCPIVANPDQADGDEDGVGNACDNCPTASNPLQTDSDADFRGDACDNCPAAANPDQADGDGDGIGNLCDNCLAVPNADQADGDSDGIGNLCDNCPAHTNPGQEDADGDGTGNACDLCTDTDGDGSGNPGYPANTCALDNCPAIANPLQEDADTDGVGDACDLCTDTDADGFGNPGYPGNACPADNCPMVSNPSQTDADADGTGDACDACTDTDGDGFGNPGYPANTCPSDTCPTVPNPGQEDTDTDGVGNACDSCPIVSNPGQENSDGYLPGVVSVWHLDDGAGTTASDSPGSNDGTLGGVPANPAWVGGHSGTALAFDGTDDYVSVPSNASLNPSRITVAAWIKAAAWAAESYMGSIVSKDDPAGKGWVLRCGKNGTLSFVVGLGGPWGQVESGQVMPLNTWTHVAGTYDGTTLKIYINGALQNSANGPGTIASSTQNVYLGANQAFSSRRFNGAIDDAAVLNRALTDSEVLGLYQVGFMDTLGDACDNCPTVSNQDQADGDGDGAGNVCDNCPAISNPGQEDGDGDGVGNVCDNCLTVSNPGQEDGDGDGVGNACDTCPAVSNPGQEDGDGDGVGNVCDNCPAVANPGQGNADGDAPGDACDPCTDTDGDGFGNPGYPANACPPDNCPTVANPGQLDADVDGTGDACDLCTDTDGDGYGNPGYPLNTCSPDNCPTAANPSQADGDYPSGIVSAWHLNEGAGSMAEDTPGANNGTLYGPTWGAGHGGTALYFDGSNDYVAVPPNASLNPAQITVAAWIKAETWRASYEMGPILVNDVGGGWALRCGGNAMGYGQLSFKVMIGSTWKDAVSGTVLTLQTWTHVAGTYDGARLTLYINGAWAGLTMGGGPIAVPASISTYMGYDWTVFNGYFRGMIDDAAVFNRALTAAEIQTLYQSGLTDGKGDACDCAPADWMTWAVPSAVSDLKISKAGTNNLTWAAPASPGCRTPLYDVLRSSSPSDFSAATCVPGESNGTDTVATDSTDPSPLLFYLLRVENACGSNMGTNSQGAPRSGIVCP